MKCVTMTKLAKLLGEKVGKDYSPSNLQSKLRRETLTFKEALIIAEILDYKLEFTPNN